LLIDEILNFQKEVVAALFAHEAVHVVQYIKEYYSPNDELGAETEAYLVQFIVQSALEFLWNTKGKIAVAPKDKLLS